MPRLPDKALSVSLAPVGSCSLWEAAGGQRGRTVLHREPKVTASVTCVVLSFSTQSQPCSWAQECGRILLLGRWDSPSEPSRRPDLRPLAQSAPCSQDLRSLAAARPGWVLAVVLAGLAVPRLCAWLRQGGLGPEFPVLDPWLHSLMATAAGRAQRPGSWVKLICMLTGNPRGPTGPGWPSCAVISQDTPIAPRQPPLI